VTWVSILLVAVFLVYPACRSSHDAISRLLLSAAENYQQSTSAADEGFSLAEQNAVRDVSTARTIRGILFADDDGDDDDDEEDGDDDENTIELPTSPTLVEHIADRSPALFRSAVANVSFLS
jgi:hypothetical protein